MPKPKVLSGKDVVKIAGLFGFQVAGQRGSHVKLRRTLPDAARQTLTVPDHKELDRGTLLSIYRQILRYVTVDKLRPHFFND